MLALKDIPGVAPVLGGTELAQSPIWEMRVDRIHPAQLTAFRAKLALCGKKAQADAAIDYVIRQVAKVDDAASMLWYVEPTEATVTVDDLLRGMKQLSRPMPAAIMFGLEMSMGADEIVCLTWRDAKKLKLTSYALRILRSQPVHISTDYVFWQEYDGRPMPLFGLEQEVFDTFGVVWGELRHSYDRTMRLT